METVLDHDILANFGGLANKSLTHILGSEYDREELESIQHSPYMTHETLIGALKGKENNFTVFSLNVYSLRKASLPRLKL